MSVAEKLTEVAENVPKVYEAGQKLWWDIYIDRHNASTIYGQYSAAGAFCGDAWNDSNFFPTKDIIVKCRTFMQSHITNLKQRCIDCGIELRSNGDGTASFRESRITHVPDISKVGLHATTYMFYNASNLHTIDGIRFNNANTHSGDPFGNCRNLVNLTLYGTVTKNLNLSWSPKLSVESMKSIIARLKNYSGTSSEFDNTVTFTKECWANLEADSASPTGGTWKEYVTALGWST